MHPRIATAREKEVALAWIFIRKRISDCLCHLSSEEVVYLPIRNLFSLNRVRKIVVVTLFIDDPFVP